MTFLKKCETHIYSFHVAAITNYHRVTSLTHKSIISQSWSMRVHMCISPAFGLTGKKALFQA